MRICLPCEFAVVYNRRRSTNRHGRCRGRRRGRNPRLISFLTAYILRLHLPRGVRSSSCEWEHSPCEGIILVFIAKLSVLGTVIGYTLTSVCPATSHSPTSPTSVLVSRPLATRSQAPPYIAQTLTLRLTDTLSHSRRFGDSILYLGS